MKTPPDTSQLALREEGDRLMTQGRRERKFVFRRNTTAALVAELDRILPSHQFEGEGSNQRPRPQHFVTTFYFDTEDSAFFRAAQASPTDNRKLRIKDYYDRHLDLASVVNDAEDLLVPSPYLWLESKRREGQATFKERTRLPRQDFPRLVRDLARAPAERPALEEWVPGTRLTPQLAVNYRRLSWQDDAGTIRLTLDLDIAFYEPPRALELTPGHRPWSPKRLGIRKAQLGSALLEVKLRTAMPSWLERTLHRLDPEESNFSKFRAGREALVRAVG